LHVKLPWPIDKVYPMHTERIQSFIVGAEPELTSVIQWTVSHGKEENFLVANRSTNRSAAATGFGDLTNAPPVSLLSVSIPVHFQITNLVSWAYVNEDPTNLLHGLAQREVMHYLAHADFDNLMSRGRETAAETLRANIQTAADNENLGARIVYVGLQDIHPPVKVAKVFEEVVGAGQTRDAKVLDALAHAASTNAWARGESNRLIDVALAIQHRSVTNAVAKAELFASQMQAYNAAPGEGGVYEQRAYLDTLVNNTTKTRKYFVPNTNSPEILIYDLEDKLRPDLVESLRAPAEKK